MSFETPWITSSVLLFGFPGVHLTSILILDDFRSLVLLSLKFLISELSPEFVEVLVVLLDVVGAVNNNHVLLVAFSSLECPVERSCHEVERIHDHILVMHVVLLVVISSSRNTFIRASFSVSSLSFHGLIISD